MSPIRVAPGGRYFETFEGQPFLFIGANEALSWPGLHGLLGRRDVPTVEKYLENLAEHGFSVVRLMLEYAHTDDFYFQNSDGSFNPALVQMWDDLFALCQQCGLRVLLTPWDTFWMRRRFAFHPFNAKNGGPARTLSAFLTDEATIELQIRRLQFAARRWGVALAAWDVWNEILPVWGGSVREQSAVLSRFSHAIREAETQTWGFSRPQTVSYIVPQPHGEYHDLIFRHPDLDFATTHIYRRGPLDAPSDTVLPAAAMGRWTRFGLQHTPPNRPFTDSEHGPLRHFLRYGPVEEAFDDEYEHNVMWAHLASGGAGSGMRWSYRHPHVLTQGMKRSLRSLADFSPLLDWRHFSPQNARQDVQIAGRAGLKVFAIRDARQALMWLLQHPGAAQPGRVLTLRGLEPGPYRVTTWHTRDGRILTQGCLQAHRNLEIPLPLWDSDVALAVRRAECPQS